MDLLEKLGKIWQGLDYPFLVGNDVELRFSEIGSQSPVDLTAIKKGDVVALIGDFDPASILTFLRLIGLGATVVPLTASTVADHEYFFESALVDWVIDGQTISRRIHDRKNPLLEELARLEHSGLVLFSTGTTARPKAILHDMTAFLAKFETPRPTLRTLNFLLFDHIGGINTLLHTMFNRGVVISPESRTVDSILATSAKYHAELIPTTPTFMRMILMSGAVPDRIPDCVKLITYGTELMDQQTLTEYCRLLPNVDFRQTYGMSELGIVRAKSEDRCSLFMRIGGEGVETKIVDNVLHIRSKSRMLGYLNAASPFDEEGWYCTSDIVAVKGEYFKIVGRTSDVVNVGGLKFMSSEVEQVALGYPGVELVKVEGKNNPITGQHVELKVQPAVNSSFELTDFREFLQARLQSHMVPRRIAVESIAVGHRFKKV